MATRNESVRLSLQDDFTSGMARATASASLLNKELNKLDGKRVSRELDGTAKSTDRVSDSMRRGGPEIDRFSGRMRLATDAVLSLGPALVPLGAAAIPALTAAFAGLGAAGGGIATALLAFNGFGDALDALNDYQADRTAENLEKLNEQLRDLGPAGADFLAYIDSLGPKLQQLQMVARAGLFPGLESGIDSMLVRLPEVRGLVRDIAEALGGLAADAGNDLAGERWEAFFDYLANDARPTLEDFARATGNVALGVSNLLVAFGPLTGDVTGGLREMSQAFADWTAGLGANQGFQEFLAYVRESGPQAVDLLGSIAQAIAALAEAAAPYGAVVLPTLTALADAFTVIAGSDIGGPLVAGAAAMLAFSRVAGPMQAVNDVLLDLRTTPNLAATSMQRFGGALKFAGSAAGMGLFLNSLQQTNKGLAAFEGAAGGAIAGLSVGGPWGAAVGGAIGLVASLGKSHEEASKEVADLTATFDQQTGAITENTRVKIAQQLQTDGLLDAATRLGIAQGTLTDAIMGSASAQDYLNSVLSGYGVDNSITSAEDLAASFSEQEVQGILADRAATQLRDTLPGLTSNFSTASGNARQLAGELGSTATTLDQTADAADGLQDALSDLDDFLNKRGTFRAYPSSLDALRASIEEAPKAWSAFGEAGRENLGNLDQVLADTSRHLETITNPKARVDFLRGVIGNLKELGDASPQAAAAVRQVIPALREVQRENRRILITADNQDAMRKAAMASEALHDLATSRTRARIEVDNSDAVSGINTVTTMLRNLNGSTATATIRTVRSDIPLPGRAEGGTVPGQRFPYADKTLIWAAPGEEVISNRYGQADRFRADRAAGRIPGYADGGEVKGDRQARMTLFASPALANMIQAANSTAGALRVLENQLKRSEKALDREKKERDNVASAMASLGASVASKFDVDLGARSSTPWAQGGGLQSMIDTAASQASAFPAIIASLKAAGLTGPALSEALQEMDFGQLQALAANPSQAASLGSSLTTLYSAQQLAGSAAGDALYGAEQRHRTKLVEQLRDEVRGLRAEVRRQTHENKKNSDDNADFVTAGVNGAAGNGHRRGQRGRR